MLQSKVIAYYFRDQARYLRMAALSQKSSVAVDQHPVSVVLQAARAETNLKAVDDPSRFDRIDMQGCDPHA